MLMCLLWNKYPLKEAAAGPEICYTEQNSQHEYLKAVTDTQEVSGAHVNNFRLALSRRVKKGPSCERILQAENFYFDLIY